MDESLDFDNPWKEAVHLLFREFLAFYFPKVQSQRDEEFPRRMMIYHCRIFDKYDGPVVSLAILADESSTWRPDHFAVEFADCQHRLDFPVAKLLDFVAPERELESNPNPFAWPTLAHLKTLQTRDSMENRKVWKIRLLKGLYQRGWNRDRIRLVFRLREWLMVLPKPDEETVWQEMQSFKQEKKMPYVLTAERVGREQGLKEGLQQARQKLLLGIDALLEVRFGNQGRVLLSEIEKLDDLDLLERILKQAKTVTSPEELRSLWQPTT